MENTSYKLEPFSTSVIQVIGTVYRVIFCEGLEETPLAYFKSKSDAELFMEVKKLKDLEPLDNRDSGQV